jgi:hypothetical protein
LTEVRIVKCPFCNEGEINVMYTPKAYGYQVTRAASNKKTIPKMFPEKYVVLVSNCPVCKHTKAEIEKRLKEGKQLSKEEIIKRMQEAGLPTRIETKA